jgi:hypothetical protein
MIAISASQLELVRSLGATPIDYRTRDFVAELKGLVVEGVFAVLIPIGPQNWSRFSAQICRRGTSSGRRSRSWKDRARLQVGGEQQRSDCGESSIQGRVPYEAERLLDGAWLSLQKTSLASGT